MRKLLLGGVVLVPLAIILGACGTNGSASKGASTAPTQAAPPSSAATTSPPSTNPPGTTTPPSTPAATPTTAPAAGPNSGNVPIFQPSTVVSQAGGHTQLTSSDGVAKVTAFYKQALSQDGWTLSSSTTTAASANFVARGNGEGATVAISTMGPSGTSISISTYPG